MQKRKVMFIGEASFLATGFGVYYNEVLKRLHKTGKFEIAEIGGYASVDDNRIHGIPWKFYPTMPSQGDQQGIEKYRSSPTAQFGEHVFDSACLEFKPDIVCVVPGAPIETTSGPVPIEHINVGDYVLTHTGAFRQVRKVYVRPYQGEVVRILLESDSVPIKVTPNHKLLVLRNCDNNPEWIAASYLTKSDRLFLPKMQAITPDDYIDVLDYISNEVLSNQVTVTHCSKTEQLPRRLLVDKDFAYFLGFVSRRLWNPADYEYSAVYNVPDDIRRIYNLKFGKAFSGSTIKFRGDLLQSLFVNMLGGDRIPRAIYLSPSWTTVKAFVRGVLLRRIDIAGVAGSVRYSDSSERFVRQLRNMLWRFGIRSTIGGAKNKWTLTFFDESAGVILAITGDKPCEPLYHDLSHPEAVKIRTIIKGREYSGLVYNLEVDDDNSYVSTCALHNCDIRDYWMCEFQDRAPSRHLWTMLWMPTVDGLPQKDLWIDSYKKCDNILTYSQFGYDALKDAGLKNLLGLASPGSDLEIFKPVPDKRAHKKQCGIDPDALIVGTTARNQSRKLFYDLIEAFATWYNQTLRTNEKLARRAFLYLHTSYPDVGYDIGRAARECKIGSRILMTYMCDKCRATYPSRFAGERTTCRACGSVDAHPPNANASVSREALAAIMNLFDVYVQYSVCWSAGTPVAMADGTQTPIESIGVGQQVLSHIGQAKTVTKVLCRPAIDLLKIIIDGDTSSYTCTPDHPIFTKRGFVTASQLQIGDYVGAPIHTPGSQPIDIDPELLGNLIGGFHYSARDAAVCAVLDWSRARYVDALVSRCSRAGCDVEINERKHQGTNVVIRQLPIWVQQAVKNHILPSISWTDDQIAKLIRGLVDSVGSLDDAGYRMGFRRRDMADIVRRLAARIGILLDIYYHGGRKAWYLRTHVVVAKRMIDTIMGKWGKPIPIDASRSLGLLIADGYIWSRVNGILPMAPKDQTVYNLEVEDDHSYVVGSIGSHNCEGWGMPITEAKSLGLPTMCVNYSAMEDHVKSTGGIAIDVGRYYHESLQQTEQRRALPDNYDFGRKLTGIFKKSEAERKMLSQKIRAWVEEPIKVPGELRKLPRFSWDYTAAVWEHWLETIATKDRTTTWDSPVPNLLLMPQSPPNNMTNTEFVHWIITNTIGKQWCRTPMADEWIRALNIGCRFVGPNKMPVDRQAVWNAFCERVKAHNDFEQQRIGRDKFNALPTTQQYLTL